MTILVRYLEDYRRSSLWWSVGLIALVLFTVSVYPSIEGQASFDELVENLPEAVRSFIGSQRDVPISSPPGYLQSRLFATLLPVVLLIFGIGAGARAIGGSEDEGTLELLLANPVTRTRVALERVLALVALLAFLVVVVAISLIALAPPFGLLEGLSALDLGAATAAAGCIALLHASLAFAVGAVTGRRGPAVATATAIAVAGSLAQSLFEVADAPRAVRMLSPWQWYLEHNALVEGLSAQAVVLPLALSVVLVAAGIAAFARRDLR
jgi:ABC-2 type transport system permease protein